MSQVHYGEWIEEISRVYLSCCIHEGSLNNKNSHVISAWGALPVLLALPAFLSKI